MRKNLLFAAALSVAFAASAVTRDGFQIRDPFVVPVDGTYYLYESKPWYGGDGVFVRTSRDLEAVTPVTDISAIPRDSILRESVGGSVFDYA